MVYDASKILFVSKDLAENYIIDTKNIPGTIQNAINIVAYSYKNKINILEMCCHNKNVAAQYGFPDLSQTWSVAELIASSHNELDSDDDMFLHQIPFAKATLESL